MWCSLELTLSLVTSNHVALGPQRSTFEVGSIRAVAEVRSVIYATPRTFYQHLFLYRRVPDGSQRWSIVVYTLVLIKTSVY